MSQEPNKLLGRLVGLRLYTIQFGPDHAQLRFEDQGSNHLPFLDCDAMPTLRASGQILRASDVGYADALVSFLSNVVTETSEEAGLGLRIAFETGSIVLNPSSEQLVSDEIATLGGFFDGSSRMWRAGEAPFESVRLG